MKRIHAFTYARRVSVAPRGYECAKCGASGVKLWRQTHMIACNMTLMCAKCAKRSERKRIDPSSRSECIGYLVPAVPTEEGDTFWGFTSVPQEGCEWWRMLL